MRASLSDRQAAVVAVPNRARGAVRLAFDVDETGGTKLQKLRHSQPLRVLFPFRSRSDVPCAVITCVSGGMAGGDRHDMSVSVGAAAQAMAIGQAPEKIYRSLGEDAHAAFRLSVGEGGWLEWLPQETILFDGARLRRITRATIAPGAVLMAGDLTVLGRLARGETFTYGLFHDDWEIWDADGTLIWKDTVRLDGDIPSIISNPACLAGARGFATLMIVAPGSGALDDWLATCRAMTEADDGVVGGATRIGDVLLVRLAARDVLAMRRKFADIWEASRARLAGLPARLPQIWHI